MSGRRISKDMMSFSHKLWTLVILQPQLFLTKTKMPRFSEGVPWIVNLDNI